MIVIDASVLSNIVGDDGPVGRSARERLRRSGSGYVPDLADVETVAVLRKRWLARDLTVGRFRQAIDELLALPLMRIPSGRMTQRAFQLRASLTAYEAMYVALAEALDCPLITADGRLARTARRLCRVEVFTP